MTGVQHIPATHHGRNQSFKIAKLSDECDKKEVGNHSADLREEVAMISEVIAIARKNQFIILLP